jgi:hypothetical protein
MSKPASQGREPPRPEHGRLLGLVGVSLTKARIPKESIEALSQARDELEEVMRLTGYLDGAPFSWVTIALRYGLNDAPQPNFQGINKKYGDLPLSIELDISPLQGAPIENYRGAYLRAAAKALVKAGEKYDRSGESLMAIAKAAGLS